MPRLKTATFLLACTTIACNAFAAGPDGKYFDATAEIEGATVRVFCPEVPNPQSVRYAWDYNPAANLTNAAGLPASLFRTNPNDER